ncbi:phospholipid phosphatase-related protein type 1-like [Liolophura sinensis]|uniref:phospholipid phosphatase-related protein type 1-like n=1 Tax=Liolophura sinensis TaxID=3198878 RepID=UPI0031585E4F
MALYTNHIQGETLDRLDLTKEMEENGRTYLDLDQSSSVSSKRERPNVFIAVTFTLELLILSAVIVLEYYIRWTDIFPMRKQNFSCVDPQISQSSSSDFLSEFAFRAHVPIEAIYALSICVPPFVISIGEIGVWAFSSDPQKVVRALCKQCQIPQVIRRLVRFIGVFLFGAFTLLIFVDVTKFMTGILRPNFLEVCQVNLTACALQNLSGDEELCSTTDYWALRDARLSFPSMHSALTSYSAVFTAFILLFVDLFMFVFVDLLMLLFVDLFIQRYGNFQRSIYEMAAAREHEKSHTQLFGPGQYLHIPRAHLRSRPPSLISDSKHRMRSGQPDERAKQKHRTLQKLELLRFSYVKEQGRQL